MIDSSFSKRWRSVFTGVTIHLLSFEQVKARLPEGMGEQAWNAIRPNLKRLNEAAAWWSIVEGPVSSRADEQDRDFLAQAAEVAARLDWSANPWAQLTAALKESTGRSGRSLFHPLRHALTGLDSGPEMAALLPLIGRDRSVERLHAAAAA